jgi:hypothetical protein
MDFLPTIILSSEDYLYNNLYNSVINLVKAPNNTRRIQATKKEVREVLGHRGFPL